MYLFLFYLATWTQDNDQNFALMSLHPTAVFKSDPDQQDSSASFCLIIHDAISYTNPSSRRIWHSYVLITEQFLLMMMVGAYCVALIVWSTNCLLCCEASADEPELLGLKLVQA